MSLESPLSNTSIESSTLFKYLSNSSFAFNFFLLSLGCFFLLNAIFNTFNKSYTTIPTHGITITTIHPTLLNINS